MRSVLSISIPPQKLALLKKKAELANMTISAYVIQKIDDAYEDSMSEEEFLKDIEQARKALKEGRCSILHRPDDLLLPELP